MRSSVAIKPRSCSPCMHVAIRGHSVTALAATWRAARRPRHGSGFVTEWFSFRHGRVLESGMFLVSSRKGSGFVTEGAH